jgi:methylmalonyl-CoA mutase
MQRVDHPDAAIANAQALHDLENGATGLTIVFAGANAARGYGLPPTKDALKRALDGVYLDAGIDIELEIGPQSRDMGQHLAELLAERKIAPSAVKVRFGLDPIGGGGVRGSSHGPGTPLPRFSAARSPSLRSSASAVPSRRPMAV